MNDIKHTFNNFYIWFFKTYTLYVFRLTLCLDDTNGGQQHQQNTSFGGQQAMNTFMSSPSHQQNGSFGGQQLQHAGGPVAHKESAKR